MIRRLFAAFIVAAAALVSAPQPSPPVAGGAHAQQLAQIVVPVPIPRVGAGGAAPVEVAVDFSTGTNFGDFTSAGGINAVFDTNTNQDAGAAAARIASDAYAGRSFASGKRFSRFRTHGTNDNGYTDTGGAGNVTIQFYGKNSAPSSSTDGTLLATISAFSDNVNESAGRDATSTDSVNTYTHVWIRVSDSGGTGAVRLAEFLAWELI